MSKTPFLPPPTGLLVPSSREYRSTSGSPTRQRHTDDLLSNLSASAVIEAFRNPSGDLKACLDAATQSEQSFAMGAAVASKKIQEWLDELSTWPWPSGGGPTGFEPATARRRLFTGSTRSGGIGSTEESVIGSGGGGASKKIWVGSLRASEVARYERRVEEIQQELDALDIEGIKNHVLHNHIMPLSRPGTPMSDSNRSSASSVGYYNKMDDLTALITATIVQALPNLSRLTRLMNTWTVRILVLGRIPAMLASLDDAEVALRSGWNAIDPDRNKKSPSSSNGDGQSTQRSTSSTLLRKDFEIMQLVLEQKVNRAAQNVDFMLDTLDGREETVPDEWIDRMDSLEHGYGEWVAACESKVRQSEWARMVRNAQMEPAPAEPPAPEQNPEQTTQAPDTTKRPSSSSSNLTTIVHDQQEDVRIETPQLHRMRNAEPSPLIKANELSPPSSPPSASLSKKHRAVSFSDSPIVVGGDPLLDDETPPKTPLDSSFLEADEEVQVTDEPETPGDYSRSPRRMSVTSEDEQLQQQISEILESIPAKIHLSSQPAPPPTPNHLNPPDLELPHLMRRPKMPGGAGQPPRSQSSMSARSAMSSRAGTPSFLLAPAYTRTTRSSRSQSRQGGEIKLYHLSRSTGEPPIKLFIRMVGEHGERVMVRVGGGWADLGEYLKEYAIHHGRRSKAGGESRVEVKDLPVAAPSNKLNSSPASITRPASALDSSPITPLNVRKTRRSVGAGGGEDALLPPSRPLPKTPLMASAVPLAADSSNNKTPSSEASTRSRSSSRLSWAEEDSSLGMSGPRARKDVEMSDESRAWVESVKEKVRIASGDRSSMGAAGSRHASAAASEHHGNGGPAQQLFGEMGKVGGTKRLFRKG